MKTLPFYLIISLVIANALPALACDPVAVPDDLELQLTSDAIVVNVLLNDEFDNIDSVTVNLLSQPEFGTATVDSKTNQIIYQSAGNQGGQITFEYEVCESSVQCGNSCSKTEVKVEVLNMPVVPDGLTLNGDGFNEGLKLTNIKKYNELDLTIVNRWGHIIYRNEDYKNSDPWRGTYGTSDEQVQPGVYYYILIPSLDGKKFEVQTSALYIFN